MNDQVCVRALGAGSPIWLFHSLLADAGSCLPLAERLSGSHRVLVADLPGFGGSPATGPDLDDVADALAGAMDRQPAVIFGNGYGSFVALTLALRHPALVTKLILAGTGAAFSDPGRAAFRAMAAAAETKGLGAIVDTAMRRLFAPDFQGAHPELLADRRARFLETDVGVFTGACAALAALDLRDAVRELSVPTLIIVGAQDEATPPPMARELAALLPQAHLIELEGCAHVPQLQAPDRVIEAIQGSSSLAPHTEAAMIAAQHALRAFVWFLYQCSVVGGLGAGFFWVPTISLLVLMALSFRTARASARKRWWWLTILPMFWVFIGLWGGFFWLDPIPTRFNSNPRWAAWPVDYGLWIFLAVGAGLIISMRGGRRFAALFATVNLYLMIGMTFMASMAVSGVWL